MNEKLVIKWFGYCLLIIPLYYFSMMVFIYLQTVHVEWLYSELFFKIYVLSFIVALLFIYISLSRIDELILKADRYIFALVLVLSYSIYSYIEISANGKAFVFNVALLVGYYWMARLKRRQTEFELEMKRMDEFIAQIHLKNKLLE